MIDFSDTRPAVRVEPAEYARLLGYPRGHVLTDRAAELEQWARAWYADNGRPWIYAREASAVAVAGTAVQIGGAEFTGARLRRVLEQAAADAVVLAAVGAGPEAEDEARRCWDDHRPDEYYFLDVYASAVVEHLAAAVGARLCALVEPQGRAVLPHDSPGFPGWPIVEQPRLLDIIRAGTPEGLPSRLEALDSGALRPKKALLAVFGVTRHRDRAPSLAGLVPCENCSLPACQYRRVPYRRARPGGTTAECR